MASSVFSLRCALIERDRFLTLQAQASARLSHSISMLAISVLDDFVNLAARGRAAAAKRATCSDKEEQVDQGRKEGI